MSSTGSAESRPPVNPRPGVVTALGICNIVFSVLTGICIFSSMFWWYAAMSRPGRLSVAVATARPAAAPTGPQPMVAFNPFMGMDDPKFLRFSLVDAGTGLAFNGLMLATGIGLVNLRRWAARWWTYLAWAKITRLFLLWGFFIVAVAPTLSENMARSVVAMFQQQQVGGRGRMPTVGDFTRIYSIMNLILAVSVIVLGSIYPAISLWLIGRPGVQAALVDKPPTEPELT
jgi:hypothetical protein